MSRFFWVANVLFRLSCNSPVDISAASENPKNSLSENGTILPSLLVSGEEGPHKTKKESEGVI